MRNRTLIVVLWRTGLRISEALALREKDVDLIEGRLVVQCGKGGKRRVVGIDQGTLDVLEEWLKRRSQVAPPAAAPLFCTRCGGPIDSSYIRRLLPRLALAAGVHKRVHAHGLRHAFATELQAEGAPLSMIRDLLGHSSLATTDTYLRRLGAGEAVEFARARTWTRRDKTPSDATDPDLSGPSRFYESRVAVMAPGRGVLRGERATGAGREGRLLPDLLRPPFLEHLIRSRFFRPGSS